MPAAHDPLQDHLLAALPAAAFERRPPHLKLVSVPLGRRCPNLASCCAMSTSPRIRSYRCYTSWRTVRQPRSRSSAMKASSESHSSCAETTPSRAVVQSAGYAYRQ